MSALFPVAIAAEDFFIGQPVRWFVSDRQISPYVGIVQAIHPGIQKLDVLFPIGGMQQRAPEELIALTPYSEFTTPIDITTKSNSYTDYMKQENKKYVVQGVSGKYNKLASDYFKKLIPLLKEASFHYNSRLPIQEAFEKIASKYVASLGEGIMKDALKMVYSSHDLIAQSNFDYGVILRLLFNYMLENDLTRKGNQIKDAFMIILNGTHSSIFTDIEDLLNEALQCQDRYRMMDLVEMAVARGNGDLATLVRPDFEEEEKEKEEKTSPKNRFEGDEK